ncbi:MAG: hypothetical protein JKY70_00035 [Mucilaginibacter sp.]|nr:hypothetical protein [Mucilaginibacter sp.]
MKKKALLVSAVLALTVFYSCKKNEVKEIAQKSAVAVAQDTIPLSLLNMNDVTFAQLANPGDHRVIAGKYDVSAQVDGNGSKASFLSPTGLFVNTDGSLLLADFDGDVRKLSHDTVVTSVKIPVDPDGFLYTGGNGVAVTTDGTMMIVADHEYWLYANGVSHYHGVDSHNQLGAAVARDPSGKYFWYSTVDGLYAITPNNENVPTQPLFADIEGFSALSASNNGVKYFASRGQMYKYTKSDVSARIFTNFTFGAITSLATTRDGFKVYLVDGGDIKVITNNSKFPKTITTLLSGEQVGSIALSNSEKYLYYTSHNTVNKLKL